MIFVYKNKDWFKLVNFFFCVLSASQITVAWCLILNWSQPILLRSKGAKERKDPRAYRHLGNSGDFNRIRTHELSNAGARLYQLSDEARCTFGSSGSICWAHSFPWIIQVSIIRDNCLNWATKCEDHFPLMSSTCTSYTYIYTSPLTGRHEPNPTQPNPTVASLVEHCTSISFESCWRHLNFSQVTLISSFTTRKNNYTSLLKW